MEIYSKIFIRDNLKQNESDSSFCDKCRTKLNEGARFCSGCGISLLKNDEPILEIGNIYNGLVKKIMDFGAFVEIAPNKEGLVHISKLSRKRINSVTEVLKEGDLISVKLLEIDKQGRINLSYIDAIEQEQSNTSICNTNLTNNNILMEIKDIFIIQGIVPVVTGKVLNGTIKLNDKVLISGDNRIENATVTGIEMSNQLHKEAKEGECAAIWLKGIKPEKIKSGYFLERC